MFATSIDSKYSKSDIIHDKDDSPIDDQRGNLFVQNIFASLKMFFQATIS